MFSRPFLLLTALDIHLRNISELLPLNGKNGFLEMTQIHSENVVPEQINELQL